MASQPPLIDERTVSHVLRMAAELAETYTGRILAPTSDALTGRVLDQDLEDANGQVILARGTYIDPSLATLIRQLPDLTEVRVQGWQKAGSIIMVDPRFLSLEGYIAEEEIVFATESDERKIPAGTVLNDILAAELSRAPGLGRVKVRVGSDAGAALLSIFARYSSLIIERLNRAPEKNFLAFLDLLGASLLPPEPARVPVTFSLTAGSTEAVVPPSTQVAAPPAEGEKDPVIYETERELIVTAAQLTSLFGRDPATDQYADRSAILATPAGLGVPIFAGSRLIEHILYIGSDIFGLPDLDTLSVTLDLLTGFENTSLAVLIWEFWNGSGWEQHAPSLDGTRSLTQTGNGLTISFFRGEDGSIKPVPLSTINSSSNHWIRCRLVTPIASEDQAGLGTVSADHLPQIRLVSVSVIASNSGLASSQAFANLLPVDLSKDFFPFGEKPRIGDTLYLAHDTAFSQPDAALTLHITLTPGVPIKTDGGAIVTWEAWTGTAWESMVAFTTPAEGTPGSFTKNGDVELELPSQMQAATVNGVTSHWIRARLSGGNYGEEAKYVKDSSPAGFSFVPATFKPPSVQKISVDYQVNPTATGNQVGIFAYNDFKYSKQFINSPFAPFQMTQDTDPALYFGLIPPPNRDRLANLTLSMYLRMADLRYGEKSAPLLPERSIRSGDPGTDVTHVFHATNTTAAPGDFVLEILGTRWPSRAEPAEMAQEFHLEPGDSIPMWMLVSIPPEVESGSRDHGWFKLTSRTDPTFGYYAEFETVNGPFDANTSSPRLVWEYWNGWTWIKLAVRDETAAFMRSGFVELLPPADFAQSLEFGLVHYWLRVRWESGDYKSSPKLSTILLNTTTAAQMVTIRNEPLGSSNGSQNQIFHTSRAPVLKNQQLQVREPELPPAEEQAKLEEEEGPNALMAIGDLAGRPREIWLRWHPVPDFYGSGPRDRHYVINHLTGEIRFGDGQSGRIPPIGAGNIRMALYKTGGGSRGNRAAGSIVQLKTTVPYVDKVTNHTEAGGGSNAETLLSLIERAPRSIRHRGRAVTVEDYEDLARLSTPEVARVKCVPLYNLATDPYSTELMPGTVSLIVVPRSASPKPLPSLELIQRVQSYLDARRIPTADLVVVGPDYMRVDIDVEIALTSLEAASTIEPAVNAALTSFLHPLTGGLDGTGWDFGRQPHESDLYALLEAIPGVDHVHQLHVTRTPDPTTSSIANRFLVHAGWITITLLFEES